MEQALEMSAVEKPVAYASVNGAWPDVVPKPSGAEAIAGARLLIREGFRFHGDMQGAKQKRKFKLTSGNRHTWPHHGVWFVNPDERNVNRVRDGWKEIVHSISHYVHQKVHPKWRPHELHAMTEKHLIEYVVQNGWLEGKLKRPSRSSKPKPNAQEVRAARVKASIKRWEAKRKRADNALRKLRKQERYYAKSLAGVEAPARP